MQELGSNWQVISLAVAVPPIMRHLLISRHAVNQIDLASRNA